MQCSQGCSTSGLSYYPSESYWRTQMAQRKKKALMSPDESAEARRRFDERTDLLGDRLAYLRSRRFEEQVLRERDEQRRAELAELGFFSRLIRRLAA